MADNQVACGQALIGALLEGCLARGIEPLLDTRACEIAMGQGPGVRPRGRPAEGTRPRDPGRGGRAGHRAATNGTPSCGPGSCPGPLTHPHSPPANEGDGLLMAMEVGADLANMNETWWYPASSVPGEEYEGRPLARFVGVERTAPHSIMVDRFGQRFVNEAANYNDMQKAFFSFDANEYSTRHLPCWVVFDHQYRSRYPVVTTPAGRPRSRVAARSTRPSTGLAHKVGIDPVGLAETVERWNRFVGDGRDRDFGRGASAYDRFHGDPAAPHPNLGTIEQGPFYALPVHVGSVGTKGGPRVDGHGRILHVRDRPIPGLYGAGNVIASPAGPAYYGGGTSIGMGMVWGHLAGAHAARRSPRPAARPTVSPGIPVPAPTDCRPAADVRADGADPGLRRAGQAGTERRRVRLHLLAGHRPGGHRRRPRARSWTPTTSWSPPTVGCTTSWPRGCRSDRWWRRSSPGGPGSTRARVAPCTSPTRRPDWCCRPASSARAFRSPSASALAAHVQGNRPGGGGQLRRRCDRNRLLPRGGQPGRPVATFRSSSSARTTATPR